MTDNKKHLHYMNELSDYKISDGYPDIRGWDVKDLNNRVIGKVDNLLVNIDAQRVVYLDVEVDKSIIDAKHDPYGRPTNQEVREFVNKDGENHIIVPIGLVDLNSDSNYVYTDILDHQTFSETKRYRKGDNIERAYENQVLNSYDRRSSSKRPEDNFITQDNFQGKNLDENRIREIVREEIRKYHENNDDYRNQSNEDMDTDRRRFQNDRDNDGSKVITDEELQLQRRRQNDDIYDDDRFYERREFEDKRFGKKRTPGL